MQTLLRRALLLAALGGVCAVCVGCATTGSPPPPTGPVEMDGTTWKMLTSSGRIDGRSVKFKKRGDNGLEGALVDQGILLRGAVGINAGMIIFQLKRKGEKAENQYEGVYKDIAADGSNQEKEVTIFVSPDSFSWNLQSATWEKVQ